MTNFRRKRVIDNDDSSIMTEVDMHGEVIEGV